MSNALLTQLRNLGNPKITIDEALTICKKLAGEHPKLKQVTARIEHLRKERDLLHELARNEMSDAGWGRSALRKWADKQKHDPDND